MLLYGPESWLTNNNNNAKLQTFVNRCLRRTLSVYWTVIISSKILYRLAIEEPIDIQIRRHKHNRKTGCELELSRIWSEIKAMEMESSMLHQGVKEPSIL